LQLYSPPSAQALLVSWPVVNVTVESPDMRRAAEIMKATMILRIPFSSRMFRSENPLLAPSLLLYSPPSAHALLVSWPLVKVVIETPDTMKAAETTSAIISLRIDSLPVMCWRCA